MAGYGLFQMGARDEKLLFEEVRVPKVNIEAELGDASWVPSEACAGAQQQA